MERGEEHDQPRDDRTEEATLGPLIRDAHAARVDVDTAARHLWVIHRLGQRLARQRSRARQTVLAGVMSFALLAASGVAVAASGSALPGDTLYPVKRGVEHVHLALTLAPEDDARLHLKLARTRLDEAVAVAPARPDALPGLFQDTARAVEQVEELSGTRFSAEVVAVRTEAAETIASLVGGVDRTVAVELQAIAEALSPTVIAVEDELPAPTQPERSLPAPVREVPEPEVAAEPEPTPTPEETAAPPSPPTPPPPPSAPERGATAAEPPAEQPPEEEPSSGRKPSIGELGEMVAERSTASDADGTGGADGGAEDD